MAVPVVLFINHREQNCGVQQFGQKLYRQLAKTTKYSVYYIDVANQEEQDYWLDILQPQFVIWNFYTHATMPWLNQEQINRYKSGVIFHEVESSLRFDVLFHQDPDVPQVGNVFPLARPIPDFDHTQKRERISDLPVFGSFGFGLGGKGFDSVVDKVNAEYGDTGAVVRINIPYAAFGDAQGTGAHSWSQSIQSRSTSPLIQLQVTHEMMTEERLLAWLFQHDMNIFMYDQNYGRGISGTLDYALAVRKPIAITPSYQFKHMIREEIDVTQRTLKQIMREGTEVLETYYYRWGGDAVAYSFEKGIEYALHI